MPKLSPLYWLIHIVFLAIYGFAVFAVTRDYYIRHPIRPVAAQGAPGASSPPAEHPTSVAPARVAAKAIQPALTETNPDVLRESAGVLFEERRYDEAIPVYRRILELDASDIDSYVDLGLALYYTGNSASALEILRKAVQAGSQNQRLWLTLGFVTLQTGDRPKAREALARARDLGADNSVGQEAARLLGLAQEP